MLRDGELVDVEMKERDGDGDARALMMSVRWKSGSNLERRRWASLSLMTTTLGMTIGKSFSLSSSSSSSEISSSILANLEISVTQKISKLVG